MKRRGKKQRCGRGPPFTYTGNSQCVICQLRTLQTQSSLLLSGFLSPPLTDYKFREEVALQVSLFILKKRLGIVSVIRKLHIMLKIYLETEKVISRLGVQGKADPNLPLKFN